MMASSKPIDLVRDAIRVVALSDSNGILLQDLWQQSTLIPADDEDVKKFVLAELRRHPQHRPG